MVTIEENITTLVSWKPSKDRENDYDIGNYRFLHIFIRIDFLWLDHNNCFFRGVYSVHL